jgi:spore maturation protein CgeB
MKIVILGLAITSSWGNGHASTYRGLLQELSARGHELLFLERNQPWYEAHRDLANPLYCQVALYESVPELKARFGAQVRGADCVIVGSYTPDGVAVGEWVTRAAGGMTAFYDIDTPVTLSKLERGDYEYLSLGLIPRYDCYLSFTGGPILDRIEREMGSPAAHPLYCSVDPSLYFPEEATHRSWGLGYLGTYSDDRQPALQRLLIEPARRLPAVSCVVAGSLYPDTLSWPANVDRIPHLNPGEHRKFYNGQRFTLNVTRAAMVRAGFSPSVRLFEAAACGTPIISDEWAGLETLFEPGVEILIAKSSRQVVEILQGMPETERREIGQRARRRVLAEHTASHRAAELEAIISGRAASASSATSGDHFM